MLNLLHRIAIAIVGAEYEMGNFETDTVPIGEIW